MHHTNESGLTPSEQKILKGCRQGKSKAQKALYDRHAKAMLGVCLRYVKDKSEAEDILQEGFIKVFKNLDKYNGKGSLTGWIYRIMVNTALNYLRSKNKVQFVEYDEDIPDTYNDDTVEVGYTRNQFMNAIQSLPDGYRIVFNLYIIEEYKHREIAEQLGISINTSKTQLAKARKMLKEKLTAIKRKEKHG
ncbi:MAG: sigma-70 family RNA polymerase sigma factor [Bacteroidales bacterium]